MLNRIVDLSTNLHMSTLELRQSAKKTLMDRGCSELEAEASAARATQDFIDQVQQPNYWMKTAIDTVTSLAESYVTKSQ